MAYYQGDYNCGDYYQGDYYQGDPFFGALIGGAVSWLGKKLLGKKTAAAAAGAVARVAARPLPSQVLRRAPGIVAGAGAGAMAMRLPQMQVPLPGGGVFRPGRILPGGVPAFSPGCCPPGQHFNKATSRARTSMGAPAGTVCVTNRRMNVANPRALRRSLRRVAGFGKLAQRSKRDVRRAAKALGA